MDQPAVGRSKTALSSHEVGPSAHELGGQTGWNRTADCGQLVPNLNPGAGIASQDQFELAQHSIPLLAALGEGCFGRGQARPAQAHVERRAQAATIAILYLLGGEPVVCNGRPRQLDLVPRFDRGEIGPRRLRCQREARRAEISGGSIGIGERSLGTGAQATPQVSFPTRSQIDTKGRALGGQDLIRGSPRNGQADEILFALRAIGIGTELRPERRTSHPGLSLGLGQTRTGDLEIVVVLQSQRHQTVEARGPHIAPPVIGNRIL